MRALSRLFLALGLTFGAAQALAAETPEEELTRLGRCAVASVAYEAAVEDGTTNSRIVAQHAAFVGIEGRLETRANALANALGEPKASQVMALVIDEFKAYADELQDPASRDTALLARLGETMDGCIVIGGGLPD